MAADFAHTKHGALALNVDVGTAQLIDQHSRSSVFGSLLSARTSSCMTTELRFDPDASNFDADKADVIKSGLLSRSGKTNFYKLVENTYVNVLKANL